MKTTSKISLTAEINILPGNENTVLKAAEAVWIATRKEPGNEAFNFNTKKDAGNTILFFEVFKSQKDFDAHCETEHTKYFMSFLKGKVVGDGPVLTFLNQFDE